MKYLTYYGSALLGMVVVTLIMKATLEPIVLSLILLTALWLIAEGISRHITKS